MKPIGSITNKDATEIEWLEKLIPVAKACVRRAIDEELWTGNLETDHQLYSYYASKEDDPIIKDLYLRVADAYGWPD